MKPLNTHCLFRRGWNMGQLEGGNGAHSPLLPLLAQGAFYLLGGPSSHTPQSCGALPGTGP